MKKIIRKIIFIIGNLNSKLKIFSGKISVAGDSNCIYLFSYKGRKNNSVSLGSFVLINQLKIRTRGTNNKVIIENNVKLKDFNLLIKGNNNTIIIKDNVNLKSTKITMEKDGNTITIGKKTTSSGIVEMYCKEGTSIKIGENCLLSRNIIFRTSDGHSILNQNNKRINQAQSINIGNSCWLSQNVTILKGTTLSEETIVGVGTILTKPFHEPNCVIVGIPGEIVKRQTTWRRDLC